MSPVPRHEKAPEKKPDTQELSLGERVLNAAKTSAEASWNFLKDSLLPKKELATKNMIAKKEMDPYDTERSTVALRRIESCQHVLA